MVIYGRLGMNRHYGDSLGGVLCSKTQPQMSMRERHFSFGNHSLLPQPSRASRLSIDTL